MSRSNLDFQHLAHRVDDITVVAVMGGIQRRVEVMDAASYQECDRASE
jgi:hypothetical protein